MTVTMINGRLQAQFPSQTVAPSKFFSLAAPL
jgi:hypothetical protein